MEYQVLGSYLGFQGVNPDLIKELLPPIDSSHLLTNCSNVLIKDGVIEKIRGLDYLNDISTQQGEAGFENVLSLDIYRKYSTGNKYLMCITPKRAYYLQNDTVWTSIGTPAGGKDSVFTCANADDKFLFTLSDEGYVYYWDGAAFDKYFASPQARFILEYKTFLILFRTIEAGTEYFQRMWPSNPGVLNTFDEKDKLDLDEEGVIEGAKILGDSIFVYMDEKIYRVYWIDATMGYGYEIAESGHGLYAPKTLCGDSRIHYYLSKQGFMKLPAGGVAQSVSKGRFDKLILGDIDPVYYYRAIAQYYPHLQHIYLVYPKSGSQYNDTEIIFDLASGELISKNTFNLGDQTCYGVFEKDLSALDPDERKKYGLSVVPIIGARDGRVYEQTINEYSFINNPYESSFTLAPTFFRNQNKVKRILQIDMLVEKKTDQNIDFIIEAANELNENYTYSYTISGTGNAGVRRYAVHELISGGVDLTGKEFTFKIKDSNNQYGWDFHGVIFKGYYMGAK
jgi:hypothetical protein